MTAPGSQILPFYPLCVTNIFTASGFSEYIAREGGVSGLFFLPFCPQFSPYLYME